MKLNLFGSLTGALLLAGSAVAAEKDIINKTFPAKAGGNLIMNVDRGSIRIATANTDKVDVKVVRELKRGSDKTAREVYADHKIEMSQNGDTVSVIVERKDRKNGLFSENPFNRLHVEYTISVPAEYNLDVRTAGGNIDISDLTGTVKAHTSGGSLSLGSINGPIDAHTSGGNISVQGGRGKANVHTSGGDLRLRNLEGDLNAKTSGGNISVDRVKGTVHAETSGGDIRVVEAHGPVNARTSGGNVSAELLEQPAANCTLKTSGGNVAITLAQQVAVDLNARTSGGSIHTDFPGDMNKNRTRLAAQINGGGPDILLETSGGNVDVRKK